ncbi:MAG: Trk system potassium transporter TrkA [Flavobacteriales bacterium]|nr:Trk system potassium transporter TrkA [Flavobacteriales bacterium]MCW8912305.1 Trk system potassium transporter TrkA [Flavobacteriales bacterium]MCW8937456.1 Trk system potassium transporter TrkA [Flavobacteriales bacterium]MCW8968369.1 Trk system potassium transporter TrkA [Flavobacteriales bacterium]MCW9019702.1 Trk system potassium transporter TrkA [Flavobacteriales bacterium]
MRIIIAGAGEVGFHLAKMMSSESQNIYIIDENEDRVNYIQAHLDVFCVLGDAKDLEVLKEQKISSCDLLIAATSSEETNLLVCITGKKLGAKRTIARINNYEGIGTSMRVFYESLGVDNIISPVELASKEINRLITQSAFTNDYEFEGGKLSVFGIPICDKSPLKDKSVVETAYLNPNRSFKPLFLLRGEKTILIQASTELKENDIVYFISTPESIPLITKICGQQFYDIKNIMILGASRIGVLTAEILEKDYNVILIEEDKNKATRIADQLKHTLVINADGTDVSVLEEENIAEMDAFIAVTGDSETNIISSLIAKSHGVKKTIAGVENIDYINLSHNIGIDTLINKKIIAANNIFTFLRKGVSAIANFHGVDGEIIEFNVKADTKILSKPLRELKLPETVSVAGVVRNNKGFIPFGGFQLEENDKVIVFSKKESILELEKLFN